MLLGYSPGHLVDWANLETGSLDLAIWPEEGIYPTRPVQSMAPPGPRLPGGTGVVCSTGGHNDLQVAPGSTAASSGPAMTAASRSARVRRSSTPTPAPVTVRQAWLSRPYGHEIAMVGGDVQTGGRLTSRAPLPRRRHVDRRL